MGYFGHGWCRLGGDRFFCFGLGGLGLFLGLLCGGAQIDGAFLGAGADTARDFALGNAGEHFCVRRGRFGPEIAIVGGEITEILGNRLHCIK